MRSASTSNLLDDPAGAWAPFEPDRGQPWDLASVSHLHSRAGFAASWAVLRRDLRDGPSASIERLLDGEPTAGDGSPAPDFESFLDAMAAKLAPSADLTGLQAIWLYRMIFTPHPLRERMTMFWHNHFATSIAKVQISALMQRQNNLFRRQALGDFRALLKAAGKDPAMLIWLDSTINRKAKPNENYAREVMELFSLGRGHYSEKDIQEAARAFTGWFVIRDEFQVVPRQHDDDVKHVLGKSGNWTGDDIPEILLEQPACADWICKKLFRHFVSDSHAPTERLLAPLCEGLPRVELPDRGAGRADPAIAPLLRRVDAAGGRSRARSSSRSGRSARSRSSSRRSSRGPSPRPAPRWDRASTRRRASPGGRAVPPGSIRPRCSPAPTWPCDCSPMTRSLGRRCDPRALAARHGFDQPEKAGRFLLDLLVPGPLGVHVREPIFKAAAAKAGSPEAALRDAARRILTLPEYQLT